MGLVVKYADLEKEEAMNGEMKELKVSLSVEKQERTISEFQSETRLARLENHSHLLQEENEWTKEFEEELDKVLKTQFEIFILQKFVKDMEEKNNSLILECQKHVEASKLAEELISELESESLEQHVEAELLLEEIESLRLGIYQVFKAIETVLGPSSNNKVPNEEIFVHHILENIEDMKHSIDKYEGDKQELLVENSVLVVLLKQLESMGTQIESKKMSMQHGFEVMAEKLVMVMNDKDELQDAHRLLKLNMNEGNQHVAILEAELGSLCAKQGDLHKLYNILQELYSQMNQENNYLLKKIADLQEEKSKMDLHNDTVLVESLATANQCEVLRSFGDQKIKEVKLLIEDLSRQHEVNDTLGDAIDYLKELLKKINDLPNELDKRDEVAKLRKTMREVGDHQVEADLPASLELPVAIVVLLVLLIRYFKGQTKDPDGHAEFTAGKDFRNVTETQRLEMADKISVMGRSAPNDKLLLVQALRKRGHVGAVTGDGTNDAPVLHEADIGLAMVIPGTEVTKETLQINVVAARSSSNVPLNAVQLLWVNLKWMGQPSDDAPWMSKTTFRSQFPDFNLEDKIVLKTDGVDREQEQGLGFEEEPRPLSVIEGGDGVKSTFVGSSF